METRGYILKTTEGETQILVFLGRFKIKSVGGRVICN